MCDNHLILFVLSHYSAAFANVCSAAWLECIYQRVTMKGMLSYGSAVALQKTY